MALKSTMGIHRDPKLNKLLKIWQTSTVMTAETLKNMDYSYQLLDKYKKSNWLSSLGSGAYAIAGQEIHWPGALYPLQKELNLPVRVGGLTALEMSGFAHYIRTDKQEIHLFGVERKKLPLWFRNIMEEENLLIIGTNFLNNAETVPLSIKEYGNFSINISAPETAYLEMLSTIPGKISFSEALEVSENLTTIRFSILQKLLESSTSIKVNRLALYLAEYHHHDWFGKLQVGKINLGKGKRVIQEKGRLDTKYNITVPYQNEAFL
ncbi:MAG: type IV toxin-antitoxin system AbiEi family antitoxin domain-containing protein [Spirochaetia bacterium]|jgi:hypothetical protein|nr:type IV toxin-antitoxin system AbiEi family antitoxin domain-containing protein [Spirochaetia bacterium]